MLLQYMFTKILANIVLPTSYIPALKKGFAIQFCLLLQNEIPKFYFNCSWTQEGGFFLLPLLGKKGSCKILFLTSGLVFLVHSQWISSSLFRGHTHIFCKVDIFARNPFTVLAVSELPSKVRAGLPRIWLNLK